MTNNDILRRIRYTFDFSDADMIEVFHAADLTVTREQVINWLKKEEDESFCKIIDKELAQFLNGLINQKRGKREGAQPEPESRLTNNMIFMKLRIAMNMKAEDILDTLKLVDFRLSKHELSAFFRKPDNKHYRECQDQILRNFLMGLQLQLRPNSTTQD
ncbi:YehS family protein [Vibrio comitans]